MRTVVRCQALPSNLGDRFSEFARLVLVPTTGGVIDFSAEAGDPRFEDLVAVATRLGITVRSSYVRDMTGSITFIGHREFDESDLAACRYVRLLIRNVASAPRDDLGRLRLKLDRNEPVESVCQMRDALCVQNRVCVQARVRRAIEQAGLRIGFRETVVYEVVNERTGRPVEVPWSAKNPEWFELTGDVILPPLGPGVVKDDARGLVYPPDFVGHCRITEPGYTDWIPRYYKADLEKLGDFDAADIAEGSPKKPYFVVTKKVVAILAELGVPCEYQCVQELDGPGYWADRAGPPT